jgi:hypothetical protein
MKLINFFDKKEINKIFFNDDTYEIIRQKIANHLKIHEKYLILINSNYVIGFLYKEKNLKLPKDFLDETPLLFIKNEDFFDEKKFTSIFTEIKYFSILDIIPNDWYDIKPINILYIWKKILKFYWPYMIYDDLINILNEKIEKNEAVNFDDEYISNILNEKITLIHEKYRKINKKYVIYTNIDMNLNYLFDQIRNADKLIYKYDNNDNYIKKISKTITDIEIIPVPKKIGIQINSHNFISKRYGEFLDENIYKRVLQLIPFVSKKMIKSSYNFKIMTKNTILDINTISKIISILSIRDLSNINNQNYYSGLYKRGNFNLYIKTNGGKIIDVILKNIFFDRDIKFSSSLIIKLFENYDKKNQKISKISLLKIKQNLKVIDPILYIYNSRKILGHILYSRRVSKHKYPISFWDDSPVYEKYIERLKKWKIQYKKEKIKNHTFKNIKTVYICFNNMNIIKSDKIYHPNKIRQIECGFYLKKKDIKSNKWYVKNYNRIKKLEKNKLSRLPKNLNILLNANRNNDNISNEPLYLLYGQNILKDNIFQLKNVKNIFDLNDKLYEKGYNIIFIEENDGNYKMHKTYFSYNLKKIIVVLITTKHHLYKRYEQINLIVSVVEISKKQYKIKKIFKKDDLIYEKMIKLANKKKIDKKNNHVHLYDIERFFDNVIQEKKEENIVEYVHINNVRFPVIPQLIDMRKKYTTKKIGLNNKKDVDKILKKIKIKIKLPILNDNKIFGYLLETEYYIFFKPEKTDLIVGMQMNISKKGTQINHIDEKYFNNEIFYKRELYWLLILHISNFISFVDIKLINNYKYNPSVDYGLMDYQKFKNKEFIDMISVCPYRLKIIEADNIKKRHELLYEIGLKITNFSNKKSMITGNIYRNLCSFDGYTSIKNQCVEKKLNISKTLYKKYINILNISLFENKNMFNQFIYNKIPIKITPATFSHDINYHFEWN